MTADNRSDILQEILSRLRELQESGREAKAPPIPLIDPTANVLALVTASIKRLDDLAEADRRWQLEIRRIEEGCSKETAELRGKLAEAELKRITALATAESTRIDAVLAEQKSAVAIANEKSNTQAATLAQQVTSSAEALRTQVASSTKSTDDKLEEVKKQQGDMERRFQNALEQRAAVIQTDIQSLRESRSEGGGRQVASDDRSKTNMSMLAIAVSLIAVTAVIVFGILRAAGH